MIASILSYSTINSTSWLATTACKQSASKCHRIISTINSLQSGKSILIDGPESCSSLIIVIQTSELLRTSCHSLDANLYSSRGNCHIISPEEHPSETILYIEINRRVLSIYTRVECCETIGKSKRKRVCRSA